jgi:hypothetical protein
MAVVRTAWRAELPCFSYLSALPGDCSKAVATPAEQEAVDETQHKITASVSKPSEAAGDSTKKVRELHYSEAYPRQVT